MDEARGTEKEGAFCPGDPDDYLYNHRTDTWFRRPPNWQSEKPVS